MEHTTEDKKKSGECANCGCLKGTHPIPECKIFVPYYQSEHTKDNWEEKFNRRFFNPQIPSPNELKRFIRQVREEAVREERDRCAGIVRNHRLSDWSGEAEVEAELEQIALKIKGKEEEK